MGSQSKVQHSQRSLNSSISRPDEPEWFCYVAGSTGSQSRWVALNCERSVTESLTSLGRVFLLRVFLFFFFKNKCCFAWS